MMEITRENIHSEIHRDILDIDRNLYIDRAPKIKIIFSPAGFSMLQGSDFYSRYWLGNDLPEFICGRPYTIEPDLDELFKVVDENDH